MNLSNTTVAQVIARLKEFPPGAFVRVLGEESRGWETRCVFQECDLQLSFLAFEHDGKTYVDIGNS